MSFFRRGKEHRTESTVKRLIYDYFGGRVDPNDKSKINLLRFIERMAFVINLANKNAKIEFTHENTMPHCDGKTAIIPVSFTHPEFWEMVFGVNPNDSTAYTIAGTLGVLLHEINHTIYTDNTNLDACIKSVVDGKSQAYYNFASRVLNVVEDIYIDEASRYAPHTKQLSRFTDETRAVTNKLNVDQIAAIEQPHFQKLAALSPIMSVDVLENPTELEQFLSTEIIDLAIQSMEIDNHNDRILHAVKITDLILEDISDEELENSMKGGDSEEIEIEISFGDDDGENESESESESEGQGKPNKIKIKMGKGGTTNDFQKLDEKTQEKIQDFFDKYGEEIKALAKELTEAVAQKLSQINSIKDEKFETIEPKVPRLAGCGQTNDKVTLYKPNGKFTNWYVDKEWLQFAKRITNSRSFKMKNPGLSYNGYEFDIDSYPNAKAGEEKVFVDALRTKVKMPPQIVIRVDGSGSTNSRHDGKTLRQIELQAVSGMMESMVVANVPFFAFMDTTGNRDNDLAIIKLGCNLLPSDFDLGNRYVKNIRDYKTRCENMDSAISSGNNDGYALEYGSMFATLKDRPKVMISVSDGAPSESRGNLNPDEYLVSVVKGLRKIGWKVYSISLVAGVVKHNDKLYGKDYNFDASRDIVGAMVSLGQRLLME